MVALAQPAPQLTQAVPAPPAPPAGMGLVIDTLEQGVAEPAQLRQQLDAARAELELTREALRWARSTAAMVDDIRRSRDRLGSKLGVLRGKYRDTLAKLGCLQQEHARCGAEGEAAPRVTDPEAKATAAPELAAVIAERDAAQQRVAELEVKVKEITSRGADFMLERNALAKSIRGWASELFGDSARTLDEAIDDIPAELARLAEQRIETDRALTTVTRERDELRRLLAASQHPAPATRRTSEAAL